MKLTLNPTKIVRIGIILMTFIASCSKPEVEEYEAPVVVEEPLSLEVYTDTEIMSDVQSNITFCTESGTVTDKRSRSVGVAPIQLQDVKVDDETCFNLYSFLPEEAIISQGIEPKIIDQKMIFENYRVPKDADDQTYFMYAARSAYDVRIFDKVVRLDYKHAFTKLNFKLSHSKDVHVEIAPNSLVIHNVKSNGNFELTWGKGFWREPAVQEYEDYQVEFAAFAFNSPGQSFDITNDKEKGGKPLLVLPQVGGLDAWDGVSTTIAEADELNQVYVSLKIKAYTLHNGAKSYSVGGETGALSTEIMEIDENGYGTVYFAIKGKSGNWEPEETNNYQFDLIENALCADGSVCFVEIGFFSWVTPWVDASIRI